MIKEIESVIKTWKMVRQWQFDGIDKEGNTCAVAIFGAHEQAVLALQKRYLTNHSSGQANCCDNPYLCWNNDHTRYVCFNCGKKSPAA